MRFLIFAFGFEDIDFDGALQLADSSLKRIKLPPSIDYSNYFLATISDGLSLTIGSTQSIPVGYLLGNFIENPTDLEESALVKRYITYLSNQSYPISNLFKTIPYKILIQDIPDINISEYLKSLVGKNCCIKLNLTKDHISELSDNDSVLIYEDDTDTSHQIVLPNTTKKM
jgi:hypothetical protein